MIDYPESRRIIRQAIADNKLVVFVGAGASVNSGIPLWGSAVQQIYDRLGSKICIDKLDYLQIPQLYYNARGEKEYNELMKTIFKFNDKNPNEIHRLIVQLNPANIITTNYDDFLERIFIDRGEFLEIIERDNDIPYARNGRMIIKMHGSFTHNNFVLKEDDYLNYSNKFPLVETYIKALLAKNVVLFIGYSYSDPDTKQIMHWIKHILGNDHQRAYLIDSGNEYDVQNANYYQNLGVNILYASLCLDKNAFQKGDHYKNTINLLSHIIADEKSSDIVEKFYDRLHPLNDLNYILCKYFTLTFSENNIYAEDTNLFTRNLGTADFFRDLATLNTADNSAANEKKRIVSEALNKSMYSSVSLKSEAEGQTWKSEVQLCFEMTSHVSEYMIHIDMQNWSELKKIANAVNLHDDKLDKQTLMQVAYSFYVVGEYEQCYYILKKLSSMFLRERNYTWYFISEFNKINVSRLYALRKPEIKEEVKKINLNMILFRNQSAWKEGQFLKELGDFNLLNILYSDIQKSSEKVVKDTRTNFVGGGHSTSTITELECKVLDFYRYITMNFLMVDHYTETREIFRGFIDISLSSHREKEVEYNDGLFGWGKNVVLKELSEFMVIVMFKYLNAKSIIEMFDKHSIKKINLSESALSATFEILRNYEKRCSEKGVHLGDDCVLKIALILLWRTSLSKENFAQIIGIANQIISEKFALVDYFNYISNFIVSKYNEGRQYIDAAALKNLLDVLCKFVTDEGKNRYIEHMVTLFKNACYILHQVDESVRLDDSQVKVLIDHSAFLLLVPLFPLVNTETKNEITNVILERLHNKNNFWLRLYCDAVYQDVIAPSSELESTMLQHIQDVNNKRLQSGGFGSFPDPFEEALENCAYLFLNNKLLDVTPFLDYLNSGGDKINFLMDMDNFVYGKFDINWMRYFSESLKQLVSNNQTAHFNIKRIYRQVFLGEEYDELMLKDYFKYFDT